MSEAHTPGSWSVEKSPPGYGVYTIAGASFQPIIITYATDLTDQQGAQRLRDASLMAAAPDLLEALENAPIIGTGETWASFRIRQDAWLSGEYRTAIAKARGQ